ncbi:hypothetical protein ACSBLW_15370 [Thioclava sp. FR2]|uniref:hypothetical protein n=1 Tax=Thioclava sp. FR2 TaxID=3445780 RepID=UPI003EBFD096
MAQDTSENAASTFALAQQVYQLGLKQGDALTVLSAARIAAGVTIQPQTAEPIDPASVDGAALGQVPLGRSKKSPLGGAPAPQANEPEINSAAQTVMAKRKAAGAAPAAPAPIMNDEEDLDLPALLGSPDDVNGRPVRRISLAANTSTASAEATGPAIADAATMLASARELAKDDEVLLGLISDAEAEGARGRIGGAMQYLAGIPSDMTDIWEIPFAARDGAELALIGDGSSLLGLVVMDDRGNEICVDTDELGVALCNFTPYTDAYFYALVINAGTTTTNYALLTN